VFEQILLLLLLLLESAAARGCLRAAAVADVRAKLAIARKPRKLEESILGNCFVRSVGICSVQVRVVSYRVVCFRSLECLNGKI
jgi:hypothetical protein